MFATSAPGSVESPAAERAAPAVERPAALPVDLDADHVDPELFERGDHAARGGERDVVLARPAAEEHGDAAAHCVAGGAAGGVGGPVS